MNEAGEGFIRAAPVGSALHSHALCLQQEICIVNHNQKTQQRHGNHGDSSSLPTLLQVRLVQQRKVLRFLQKVSWFVSLQQQNTSTLSISLQLRFRHGCLIFLCQRFFIDLFVKRDHSRQSQVVVSARHLIRSLLSPTGRRSRRGRSPENFQHESGEDEDSGPTPQPQTGETQTVTSGLTSDLRLRRSEADADVTQTCDPSLLIHYNSFLMS